MERDRKLSPTSGDYIPTTTGSWELTRTAETAIYHALRCDKGQWALDPEAGSRLFELARAKSQMRTPVVVADMIREALAPLVAAGLISEAVIETERDMDQVAQRIVVTDLQSGSQIDLSPMLPFDP